MGATLLAHLDRAERAQFVGQLERLVVAVRASGGLADGEGA